MLNWLWSLFKKKEIKKRIISDDDFNINRRNRQDRLDSILEKIYKNGLKSLSQKEIDFLNSFKN